LDLLPASPTGAFGPELAPGAGVAAVFPSPTCEPRPDPPALAGVDEPLPVVCASAPVEDSISTASVAINRIFMISPRSVSGGRLRNGSVRMPV
jgi:hypothetical protein